MAAQPHAAPRRPYQAHRDRQRRRILDAAATLFDLRGIDHVAVADITSASGLRASTLYQYFANKDEIVWALLELYMRDAALQAAPHFSTRTASALQRITALLESFAAQLENQPAQVRFMAQFDAMYARTWSADQLLAVEARIVPNGWKGLRALIRKGVADGSLRSDLDPDLTMQAILNAVIGAQRRLASLGDRVEKEYGQPVHRMFRETIRVILLGLRAPATPAATAPPGKPKARPQLSKKRVLR